MYFTREEHQSSVQEKKNILGIKFFYFIFWMMAVYVWLSVYSSEECPGEK